MNVTEGEFEQKESSTADQLSLSLPWRAFRGVIVFDNN